MDGARRDGRGVHAASINPATATAPRQRAATVAGGSRDALSTDRSTATAALTATALVGNKAKAMLVDRPRAIAAFSHARRQQKLGKWVLEVLTGKLTNDVVPITGGTIRVAGTTVTTRGWQRSYQASNGVGLALLGVSMLYGFPNLVEGWRDGGGAAGLTDTRQGRTGLLATAGNLVALGAMGIAWRRAPGGGGRIAAMLRDPIHSSTPMVLTRIAVSLPVTVNELGYLDFLDRDATAGARRVAAATTRRHLQTLRELFPEG